MRLHRFYITQKVGEAKEITLSDTELVHQLANVFRFKIGDQVIVFDGFGSEYIGEIISLSKKEAVLNILSHSEKKNISKPGVSLYLALIKKGNFELATEKCTEVGVSEIHPIVSERSEKKDLNLERLGKIVKEASEQSGRFDLPKIFDVTDLKEAVSQAVKDNRRCVVFHTSTTEWHNRPGHQNDHPALTKAGIVGRQMAAFVGPEGGWTDKEMEIFKDNNFEICSLGQNILRAETAAIVACWYFLNYF